MKSGRDGQTFDGSRRGYLAGVKAIREPRQARRFRRNARARRATDPAKAPTCRGPPTPGRNPSYWRWTSHRRRWNLRRIAPWL